jgi:hypothetical protein
VSQNHRRDFVDPRAVARRCIMGMPMRKDVSRSISRDATRDRGCDDDRTDNARVEPLSMQ